MGAHRRFTLAQREAGGRREAVGGDWEGVVWSEQTEVIETKSSGNHIVNVYLIEMGRVWTRLKSCLGRQVELYFGGIG